MRITSGFMLRHIIFIGTFESSRVATTKNESESEGIEISAHKENDYKRHCEHKFHARIHAVDDGGAGIILADSDIAYHTIPLPSK